MHSIVAHRHKNDNECEMKNVAIYSILLFFHSSNEQQTKNDLEAEKTLSQAKQIVSHLFQSSSSYDDFCSLAASFILCNSFRLFDILLLTKS